MPFVDETHRADPDMQVPGDRCYLFYREIMEEWKRAPRWTTVDTIMTKLLNFLDGHDVNQASRSAALLAFMVFFAREVMPYEEKKCRENGEI